MSLAPPSTDASTGPARKQVLVFRELPPDQLARGPQLPGDREAAMDTYRDALQRRLGDRFNPADWQPTLDLSILGGLIRFGWFTATAITRNEPYARADLDWWAERAWAGVERVMGDAGRGSS